MVRIYLKIVNVLFNCGLGFTSIFAAQLTSEKSKIIIWSSFQLRLAASRWELGSQFLHCKKILLFLIWCLFCIVLYYKKLWVVDPSRSRFENRRHIWAKMPSILNSNLNNHSIFENRTSAVLYTARIFEATRHSEYCGWAVLAKTTHFPPKYNAQHVFRRWYADQSVNSGNLFSSECCFLFLLCSCQLK